MARIEDFVRELFWLIEPVAAGLEDDESLSEFFAEFGYDLGPHGPADVLRQLTDAPDSLRAVFASIGDALSGNGALDLDGAKALFTALNSFAENGAVGGVAGDPDGFAEEVFAYLVHRYLAGRVPVAAAALKAIGAIDVKPVKKTDPGGRQFDYEHVELRWSVLGDFIRDNGRWARETYGWGTAASSGGGFDYTHALASLVSVIDATGLSLASWRNLTAVEATAFLKNGGTADVSAVTLPFRQAGFIGLDDQDNPEFAAEIGLKVVPSGDLNDPPKLGLAVAPYAKGDLAVGFDPMPRLHIDLEVDAAATGGAYLEIAPTGIRVVQGGSVDAGFEFGATYRNADDKPLVLVGDPGASRIEAEAVVFSAGGSLSGDFFVAGGFKGLRAVIDLGEDGFLGSIVPEPIAIEAGTLLLGWRAGRGVYFDGGTSLMVTVPLDLDFGFIAIYELGLKLDWSEHLETTLLITADAEVGPLYAYVENAGLVVTAVPAPDGDGLIGRYDLKFGFRAPTGYAVALRAEPIEGGGFLSVQEHEYRGALALKFQTFGFSAFAILNTELPGGNQGFSLAASIFGEFSMPLGYGFFLTGLGGVIGIHRTIDTDALRDVLYSGRLDSILFPNDPIANAKTILDDMAAILPPAEGQHVFGPVARIGWGQPVLVDVTLGLVLEVGGEVRILVLGKLGCNLPTKDSALVAMNLSFFGEIDFAAGTISFDATLQGSRVLTWPISGDAAIRTGWGTIPAHVAAFGGLHPQYPRPANLPDLRRLSINFGTNNPKITLSAYQATTLNSLQFGARADLYAKGPKIILLGRVAAEGWVSFDALIYFNPFAFDVALSAGLSLLVDGKVKASLGFALRLTGPNTFKISGKVWVTVCGVDVKFPISHTWGSKKSLPTVTADGAQVLRAALVESRGFEPLSPTSHSVGVVFRDAEDVEGAIDPVGGLRFVQRAVPLSVRIDKIGEAQMVGARTLDLRITGTTTGEADLEFVRGHFFNLTEGERLRAPAFDRHKAGFSIAGDELVSPADTAVVSEYLYEIIRIGMDHVRNEPLHVVARPIVPAAFGARYMNATHEELMRPRESYRDVFAPAVPVTVLDNRYVPQCDFAGAAAAAAGADAVSVFTAPELVETTLSAALARAAVAERSYANAAVADYVAACTFRRQ